ncbi:MAG TPA: hypothetical protein VNS81_00230 [Nocardioides sp.]|nr:hypothetical protein [Nocardioides sp.]
MSRRLASVVVTLLLLATSGCGSEDPPGTDVPELSVQLARVDTAVGAHDWAEARTAVKELLARTATALQAGDISEEEAARIRNAARDLLARMVVRKPTPTTTPTPSSSPTITRTTAPHTTTKKKPAPRRAPKHTTTKKTPHKTKHHGKGKKH